jgi:hypothetical protein
MKEIILYDGKYHFYEDEKGTLYCKRYGDDWRDFLGDHAVSLLFDRAIELEEENRVLKEECVNGKS